MPCQPRLNTSWDPRWRCRAEGVADGDTTDRASGPGANVEDSRGPDSFSTVTSLGFGAWRFGAQVVGLLTGAGSKLGSVHQSDSAPAVRQVPSHERSDRQLDALHCEQLPFVGYAFECVGPTVGEAHAGPGNEILDRARHQNLTGLREGVDSLALSLAPPTSSTFGRARKRRPDRSSPDRLPASMKQECSPYSRVASLCLRVIRPARPCDLEFLGAQRQPCLRFAGVQADWPCFARLQVRSTRPQGDVTT